MSEPYLEVSSVALLATESRYEEHKCNTGCEKLVFGFVNHKNSIDKRVEATLKIHCRQ